VQRLYNDSSIQNRAVSEFLSEGSEIQGRKPEEYKRPACEDVKIVSDS
jgi:hypothetical protein